MVDQAFTMAKIAPLHPEGYCGGNQWYYLIVEFTDELALIIFPPGNDDLLFDAESDLRELEYLLNHDPIKEMDFLSLEDWMRKSLLMNICILIHENLFEVTNCATPEKNIKKATNASLILEDFNPPLYELHFHKEFTKIRALLSFLSENEKKFITPGFSLLKEFILLFSRNYLIGALKLSKSLKFLEARWRFFLALTKRIYECGCSFVSKSIPLDKLKIDWFLKPLLLGGFVLSVSQELPHPHASFCGYDSKILSVL
ncbi:hypothetical protein Tco_0664791 [Tanacetum coccineum]